MNEQEKTVRFEAYNRRTHTYGRIACGVTLVLLLGAPFLMGYILGAMPDMRAFGRGFLAIGIVWLVSCVAEYLVYTPMLGAGGGYLAFITGNLINMKIPCAVNARDIVGAKTGTPENEIISTLSPVLQSPALQPAFDNVVPALFGAMAYKYYRKNMKIALWPLVLMSVLFILVPGLLGSTSFMILPSGAIAIGVAYFRYRRSRKETAA